MSTRTYGNSRRLQLQMRVSAEEKAKVLADAKASGLSASDYLRSLALSDTSPETVAAAHLVANQLDGLEDAVHRARALLAGQKGA